MTAPRTKQYMTIEQAADHLQVCTRSIRAYIASGRLPARRLGARLIRLDAADVEGLLVDVPTVRTAA